MPTYVFEDHRGNRIEQMFPMSSVPDSITINERVFKRIIVCSGAQISMGELGHQDKYPYLAKSLPSTIEGCKKVNVRNKKGKVNTFPLIESRKQEKNLQAMYGLEKD